MEFSTAIVMLIFVYILWIDSGSYFRKSSPEELKYFRDRVQAYKDGLIEISGLPYPICIPRGISRKERKEVEKLWHDKANKNHDKGREIFYEKLKD